MTSTPPSDGRTVGYSRSLLVATSTMVEGIPDEQKTSPVRRVFCLLCLFDLICIVIIWIIYVRLISPSIVGGFNDQVVNFRMEQSMFDLVMLAVLRLVIQEFAYGILQARKPWWTALSTSITCIYLLIKIFFYDFKHTDFNKNSVNAMDYLLMLASFVICWAETWFLDFRVLPKEKAARQLTEEASSLLHVGGDRRQSYHSFNPNDRFFSPATSTPYGTSRYNSNRPTVYHSLSGSPITEEAIPEQLNPLLLKASEAFDQACTLYADGREWIHEKGDAIQGCIYSRQLSRKTRIYKLEVLLPISSVRLLHEYVDNVEETHIWNSTVNSVKRIQKIDSETDVVYSISTDTLKGAVSARDCVCVRRWRQISPRLYIVANQSVEHSSCPVDPRYVRAINGVGLTAFETVEGFTEQCKFTWILNTNLKGWLPKAVVEQAMTTAMAGYINDLRGRVDVLNGNIPL